MNLALWIVAALLAAVFLGSGVMKLVQPKAKLASSMDVLNDFGAGTIKMIGTLEVLAAVGLVLPAALDVAPVLVPVAGVGLVLLMVGALLTHLRRRELWAVVPILVLIALTGLVVWGRLGPESFVS
jgi:hypothetical protein